MSEYVTITIKLKRELAEKINGFEAAVAIARVRSSAYEYAGNPDGAGSEEREAHRIQDDAVPYVEQVEKCARDFAHAKGIAISEMPAWRIQFCRADSSVAMVEFLAPEGY